MAEKKITKSQRFEDIIAILTGETPTHGTTVDIAIDVLNHERDLLAKKNSADRKPTEEQKKNEGYCDLIVEYLSTCTEGKTCTEIQRAVPEFKDFNNQKIASLMRILKNAERVTRTEGKGGKTLFALA
jgi:hypothetical protein